MIVRVTLSYLSDPLPLLRRMRSSDPCRVHRASGAYSRCSQGCYRRNAHTPAARIRAAGVQSEGFPSKLTEFFGHMRGLDDRAPIATEAPFRHLDEAVNGPLIRRNPCACDGAMIAGPANRCKHLGPADRRDETRFRFEALRSLSRMLPAAPVYSLQGYRLTSDRTRSPPTPHEPAG